MAPNRRLVRSFPGGGYYGWRVNVLSQKRLLVRLYVQGVDALCIGVVGVVGVVPRPYKAWGEP